MKKLWIAIHFPSCKSQKILSDDFAAALKAEFQNDQYDLKFSFSDHQGLFPDGISGWEIEGADSRENELVRQRIKQVFSRLLSQILPAKPVA